ncbi:hypothetical protein CLF_110000 [Clonorchis sinensis]|uniref:Peptidase A1 domain-containing protein n=1 Tax=Clonorchis sinensis TaxID=79923 RepID=G7YT33_CLOSI|nr:hypothetical protein CLF_110000 [Clonorchis sinensis]
MEYGGQILCELCTAVVDTGAPTTIVPLGKVQLLLQNPELKDNQQGVLYVEPQDVPLVKDFKITFGQRVFTIPPKEMLLSKPTYSVYGLGYIVNYQRLEWTVGLSILRSFHTIFDDRLAFVRNGHVVSRLYFDIHLNDQDRVHHQSMLQMMYCQSYNPQADLNPLLRVVGKGRDRHNLPTVFSQRGSRSHVSPNSWQANVKRSSTTEGIKVDYRSAGKIRLGFVGVEVLCQELSAFLMVQLAARLTVLVAAFDKQMFILHVHGYNAACTQAQLDWAVQHALKSLVKMEI